MSNRLAGEKSPYLLQHANNPVDWYPWGEEALRRAQQEDRPILVSIGYSACHWCHVMAHESFENEATARLMNERLVNVKVDREERPDVDAIYMEAVQALTGSGGWPLNAFLTPDGRPFFGGTYFPPSPRHGMPSWAQVVESVTDAYRERHTDVLRNAAILTEHIGAAQNIPSQDLALSRSLMEDAYHAAGEQFDEARGGFGGAPKFPQPLGLEMVLRLAMNTGDDAGLDFVWETLRAMASGGIYDQIGGGFHRYSVDADWLVPHFEKMLYDNALLMRVYLHAHQVTGFEEFRDIVTETADYVLRDLLASTGGFYCAQDADSEGVEGKYYVWTPEDVFSALESEEAAIALLRFGIERGGNFEGKTILTAAMSQEDIANRLSISEGAVSECLPRARSAMLRRRKERIAPGTDTKILVSWNALAIEALAEAGRALGIDRYIVAARRATDFVLTQMRPGGELVRSFRDGPSGIPAFLEDYTYLASALLTLYETVSDRRYLDEARTLIDETERRFGADGGAYFDSQSGDATLAVRPRGLFDNPIPSGNSAAAHVLLRLAALTGEDRYADRAEAILRAAAPFIGRAPLAVSHMVCALDFYLSTPLQIAVVGPDGAQRGALLSSIFERYLPTAVLAAGEGDEPALLSGRGTLDGKVTAYVCRNFACRLPVTEPAALAAQL